jgi:hypothetical protein
VTRFPDQWMPQNIDEFRDDVTVCESTERIDSQYDPADSILLIDQ